MPRATYRVDTSRVYITGLSSGARGAWNAMLQRPARFAAAVLIAGNVDTASSCLLTNVPIWIFHNRDDPVVPVSASQSLYAAHQRCGGETKLTIYDTVSPGTWAH